MISVIGGGPAGCHAASLLAKAGKEVRIFEEHKSIGSPVQCTGIVTSSINNIIKIKKSCIINKISRAKIISGKNSAELKLKNSNLILDREKFDQHIAEKAKSAGAKLFLNHKYINNNKNKLVTNKKTFKTNKINTIIGADGPLSSVAKANNMFNKRKFWQGIQARVKLKNENIVEFYPNIGTFAWVVPENKDIVRIGLLAEKNTSQIFQKFLKTRIKNPKNKIIEHQGGIIPKYNPPQITQKIQKDNNNIYLVGDAAGQVKATTGGGIIQGLEAAEALTDSIINKKDYETEWKKKIGKDLWVHLKMRNIMDKFKNQDWQFLINLCRKESAKSVLEKHDRDYPSKFLIKMLFTEPRLLYFAKFLL